MAINKSKKELVDLLFTLSPDAITGIVKTQPSVSNPSNQLLPPKWSVFLVFFKNHLGRDLDNAVVRAYCKVVIIKEEFGGKDGNFNQR